LENKPGIIPDVNLSCDFLLKESDQTASPMKRIIDSFLQPEVPVQNLPGFTGKGGIGLCNSSLTSEVAHSPGL